MADYIYREALQNYIDEMDFIDDREVRAKAIDEFAEKLIELADEFPLVENEDGEKRPMTIEEMCNQVAEQLKEGGK